MARRVSGGAADLLRQKASLIETVPYRRVGVSELRAGAAFPAPEVEGIVDRGAKCQVEGPAVAQGRIGFLNPTFLQVRASRSHVSTHLSYLIHLTQFI